ncbi:MAG TPA: DMT family transporter, partial [Aestuariivirga sp.]|nr:DMT family transporter [Aestuariivirga sp.]
RGTMEMSAAMLISGAIGWFVVVSGQPVFNVVFWRCLFAVFALLAVCGLLGLLKPITMKVLGLAMLGGVAIVLNWVCLFAAYAGTSISLATIIYNTQPFMLLVLGGLFLGERITATKLGWLTISFAGMLLIVLTPDGQSASTNFLLGVGLSLTAAFLYAIATLVTKQLKGTPPHLIALIQVATGMVMLAPLADFSTLPTSGSQWLSLVTIGIVHTGLMYYLLYGAIQKLPTHIIGALSFIYPAVAVLVDMVAFDHVLRPVQFLGGALILLAAAASTFGWSFSKTRRATETS